MKIEELLNWEGEFVSKYKKLPQIVIDSFALLTGDDNPIHTDFDAARAVGLPSTIAHGFLVLSLVPWLMDLEFTKGVKVLERGVKNWKMKSLIPSGSEIRLRASIEKIVRKKVVFVNVHCCIEVKGGSEAAHGTIVLAFMD